MRILVVSDTHGNDAALLKAYGAAGAFDVVMHLGDGERDMELLTSLDDTLPQVVVAGNCDLASTQPRERICSFKGLRLLVCHGDRYGVKAGLSRLVEHGREVGVDAVLYGHTHVANIVQVDGLWLINPGTLTAASSFHSYAMLEITEAGLNATIHPLT